MCAPRGKGVRGELVGEKLRQSKTQTLLPNTCQYNVSLYLAQFDRNFNERIMIPISTPRSGELGHIKPMGVENGANRNLDQHSYSTSIPTTRLTCTFCPQRTNLLY